MSPQLFRTGEWFLRSGIQQTNGGVARYYLTDSHRNLAASTEITGYAISTFAYLHSLNGDARYLECALAGANFLAHCAWDQVARTMPFEVGPAEFSYFFDCGIIVRGLLAVWRATGEQEFLDVAIGTGDSMAKDFAGADGSFHPIITLPEKEALEREPLRWSRSATCYQLKSAMAWWDLYEATGEKRFVEPMERVLEASLRTFASFLPGHPERAKVMDRLHAFSYFLEGLLPWVNDPRCAAALREGIGMAAYHLGDVAPEFERSDVYGQVLRARIYADALGVLPLDLDAATHEAERLASFQVTTDDPRIDGGYWFGRKGDEFLPYVNPVSAAFCSQALELWETHRAGGVPVHLRLLI